MMQMKKTLLFLVAVFFLMLSMTGLAEVLPEDWTVPGSTVVYGMLEQDNNFDNGPEPLEWIVLTSDGENSLVVTRDAVVLYRFGMFSVQPRWSSCEARSLLNENFAESTFTDEELARILPADAYDAMSYPDERGDRLFLLSEEEYTAYLAGTDGAVAAYTPFVRAALEARLQALEGKKSVRDDERVSRHAKSGEAWWLRTALEYVDTYDGGMGIVAVKQVLSDGTIKSDDPGYTAALRPAMWVKVCSEEPTPEPTPEQFSKPVPTPKPSPTPVPTPEVLDLSSYDLFSIPETSTDNFRIESHTCTADGIIADRYGMYVKSYTGGNRDIRLPETMYSDMSCEIEDVCLIMKEAFAGTDVERVVLPQSISFICERAFADCTSLREIAILYKGVDIHPLAFEGCSEDLIIYGYRGSEAEEAAEILGCYFEAIDE